MANLVLKYGNHACAEAAILVGCDFYAGYPITPSSEVAEKMSELLPKRTELSFRWKTKLPQWEQLLVLLWLEQKQ